MNKYRNLTLVVLIVLNIALDQISKILVRSYIKSHETISLIGDYFLLTSVENKGAFLSFGSDFNPIIKFIFLIILPVAVLGYVTYYVYKTTTLSFSNSIAFCLVIGGGISNIFDRIVLGSVTDFLFIDLGGVFKTGIFNIADVSVTTGIIILIISSFRSKKQQNS